MISLLNPDVLNQSLLLFLGYLSASSMGEKSDALTSPCSGEK